MKKYKKHAVVVGCLVLLGLFFVAIGGREAVTQVKAALVRDIDNPALTPFRAGVDYQLCCINDQRLLTTVPAGKRLIIEYISYSSYGPTGDEMIYGALRNGQFGPAAVLFEIHPPHASTLPSLTIQDGSLPVKAYFEAGEQVWVSVSHNTGGSRQAEVRVSGYLVTP